MMDLKKFTCEFIFLIDWTDESTNHGDFHNVRWDPRWSQCNVPTGAKQSEWICHAIKIFNEYSYNFINIHPVVIQIQILLFHTQQFQRQW